MKITVICNNCNTVIRYKIENFDLKWNTSEIQWFVKNIPQQSHSHIEHPSRQVK